MVKRSRSEHNSVTLFAQHISKSYKNKRVVNDLSLSVTSGEIVGLLGPNGAGKTTAFYMLAGLICPDQGDILYGNLSINDLPLYQRARLGIGYLPQESSTFRGLTVQENILSILQYTVADRKKRDAYLEELLKEFGLLEIRSSSASTLSGGERRRCEVARLLASFPKIVLFDEPFAGVDPISVNDIHSLMYSLKQKGLGILLTDHNAQATLKMVDRAYLLYEGRVIVEGSRDSILNDTHARTLYLGEEFKL